MDQITFPIRVFKQLGVDTVVCKSIRKVLASVLQETETNNHDWQ